MASLEPSIFGFLAAALGAVAFMFQSRHHNLYGHESTIENEINELEDRITELRASGENSRRALITVWETRIEKKMGEYIWVRRRYNSALGALIFLMLSLTCVLLCGIRAAYTGGLVNLDTPLVIFSVVTLVLAFGLHICGDLFLAFVNQREIRRRLAVKKVFLRTGHPSLTESASG